VHLVAGGHTTETLASTTYSSILSQESIQIAFLIATLNGLDVFVADVGNAYLIVPCWGETGPKLGKSLVEMKDV